jgi:hypothetical protein
LLALDDPCVELMPMGVQYLACLEGKSRHVGRLEGAAVAVEDADEAHDL